MQKADGIFYAPEAAGVKVAVVRPGEFCFAAVGLDHGHIYGMTNGLKEAGATLKYVSDSDPKKVEAYRKRYPEAQPATLDEILADSSIRLVASAIRPDKRAGLGIQVMEKGKDYFADKPGMLKLEEVDAVRETIKKTGRKYFVYFSERVHVEGAVYTEKLIREGKLGDIVSITILAPHRLNPASRPDWFWDPGKNGSIIGDIGSHQIEQLLTYAGAKTATITQSTMGNFNNPSHPQFFDYGDVSLVCDNGTVGYCRVDWFTPDGLGAWGDGRVFIVGTKATVEIRKYIDVARDGAGDQVYVVDGSGEHHVCATGKTGFPFFGEMILDCINRTEKAITEEHVLESMRITIEAANHAKRIRR